MLRPEDRLLLACSRADVGDTQVATTFDALGEGVDWRYVVEASIRHAVAPLMSNGLDLVERADPRLRDVVPPDVRQELDELRRGTARRSARLFGIVGEIADQFEPRDIALLALKDLQLAIEVYPDPSLRPMGDVDLLIRREDWSSAASALAELDFAPVPDRHQPFTDRYAGGRQFRRAADETWIDLQWHIAEREWDREGIGRFTFDTGRVWDRSQPLAVAGRKILAPSPEDMLIHLCLHLEGHEYSELVLFSDIVTFLARGASQLDWDGLVAVAHASGGASGVHQVLAVTERLFGSAPPDGVIEALRPTYFRGSLNTPLFGNSTTLHLALDDIAAAHDPPQELLTEV
jgi:hypothetical protein